jgi:hypothetical protein
MMPPLPLPSVRFADKPAFAVAPPTYESLAPLSFWNQQQASTVEPSKAVVTSLLTELRHMRDDDPRLLPRLDDFDMACSVVVRHLGISQADKIDTATRFSFFPTRREPSQFDLRGIELPEAMSTSDIMDLPPLTMSFPSHLYAADMPHTPAAPVNIWQTRGYTDTKLAAFESTSLTDNLAAFVYLPTGGAARTLSIKFYGERNDFWTTYRVECPDRIEAMAVDDRHAWMFTSNRLYRASLSNSSPTEIVDLGVPNPGKCLTTWSSGVICGSRSSSQLVFLSAFLSVTQLETRYRGMNGIEAIGDHFLCAIVGSCALRMIGSDGREIRAFIGHCGPATGIARLADATFASRGEDASVRIWDVRERFPILSICSNGPAVMNIAGSRDFVVSALRDKTMSVFDLRKPGGKPVLALATQDYEPADLSYSEGHDRLTMFGVMDAETPVFPENDGKGQRIFRMYSGFVGPRTA